MNNMITALNEGCFCVSLDQQALREAMESTLGEPGLMKLFEERCPHAFSSSPVFMAARGDSSETSTARLLTRGTK